MNANTLFPSLINWARIRSHANLRKRLRAVQISVLLGGCLWSPASHAEDLPKTISPLVVEEDPNGVNIATGKMTIPALTLSLPGAGRLKFDRVQNAAPYSTGKHEILRDAGDDLQAQYTVHTAEGSSEGFRCTSGGTAPTKGCFGQNGQGSTLNYGGWDYRRAGSGERYRFDVPFAYSQANQPGSYDQYGVMTSYASSIEYPDGEVIAYTYDTAQIDTGGTQPHTYLRRRPTKVRTNLGYFVTIAYSQNDPTQNDWATPFEAAIFSDAAPTTAIQRFTYSGTLSSPITTDITGRQFVGFGAGSLNLDIEQTGALQTLPTESGPALQAAQSPSGGMVGTLTRDGVQWTYEYPGAQLENGLRYSYDRVQVSGPNGYYQDYDIVQGGSQTLGAQNVVVSRTDALGRKTTFDRDQYLRVTKITAPEGNYVTLTYDDAGNITNRTAVAKVGSALASLTEQTYRDLSGYVNEGGYLDCREVIVCYRPQWYKDAKGNQTDFTYNSRGQLTEQLDPPDQYGYRRKTIHEYQEVDTGRTHTNGQTVVPEYISRKVRTRTCGVGTTCGVSDDSKVEYDYVGTTFLVATERRIDPGTGAIRETKYTYDAAGRVASIDGPYSGTDDTQYFLYDAVGRKTWEIGPLSNGKRMAKFYTYRAADDKVTRVQTGTVTDVVNPVLAELERVDFTYDSRRNAIREQRTSGTEKTVTDRSYLDRGLLECTAVRMNMAALPAASATGACTKGAEGSFRNDRITKNIYDAAGQLVQVREGVGVIQVEAAEASYEYSSNGKRKTVVDANGNKAQLVYDGHDRLSSWLFPSTTRPGAFNDSPSTAISTAGAVNVNDHEDYGYDANGNRTSLRKRDGSVITYVFDNLNRMIRKYVPERSGLDPSATRDVFYAYDINGLMTRARFDTTGGNGVTYTYTGFGELKTSRLIMGTLDRTLTYTYDAAGKRISVKHPDNQLFGYGRDMLGRVTSIYEGATLSDATQLATANYTDRGLVDTVQRETDGSAFATTFKWDVLGRMKLMTNDAGGTTWDNTLTQTFNPASQIYTQSRTNDLYAWTSASPGARTYTTNGLNQYSGMTTTSSPDPLAFTYDANGNMTSDGSSTFLYDVENRLVERRTANSASNPQCPTDPSCLLASLVYDPMGRLFQVSGGSGGVQKMLYDGDELVGEYDSNNTLSRRYVHSDNADDPLVQYSGTAVGSVNRTYLMPDERGSIVALVGATGTVSTINSYDEYGLPKMDANAQSLNVGRFQYTGQIWLPELGMYYYKARVYSPSLGRFLQVDPIGYDDQVNLYAYVGNDPMNMADPSGMAGQCDTGSRLPGASSFCMVGDGYQIEGQSGDYRHRLAAAGAGAGAVIGAVMGGATGGTAGGAAGLACGPGAPACSTAGAVAGGTLGAIEGGTLGAATGGAVGGILGTVIDGAIALYNRNSNGDSQSGSSSGGRLPPAVQRSLGNLANRAKESAASVAKSRGASASNVRLMGHWGDKPLGEVARAAYGGDAQAARALKIAKEAYRLGQRY